MRGVGARIGGESSSRCAITTSTDPGCPATPRMPAWLPSSAARSPRDGRPQVFEDGGQTRDFVHVVDVARANVLALTAPDDVAGAYNVASGTPHTVARDGRPR